MYYICYHIFEVENKWVVLFNSFLYSTTHMINPVIYFSLNKEMRLQLYKAFSDFVEWLRCYNLKSNRSYGSIRKTSIDQRFV